MEHTCILCGEQTAPEPRTWCMKCDQTTFKSEYGDPWKFFALLTNCALRKHIMEQRLGTVSKVQHGHLLLSKEEFRVELQKFYCRHEELIKRARTGYGLETPNDFIDTL